MLIGKILIALDGSEQSQYALDYAFEFAESCGAELTILSVIPRIMIPLSLRAFSRGFGHMRLIDTRKLSQYQKMMVTYQKILAKAEERIRLEHPSLRFMLRLEEGDPLDIIVDVAEEEGCDIIVMGDHGRGGIMGWLLGSTSHRVAASCKKPVMIIK